MNYLCHATKVMGIFQCEEPVTLQTQQAFMEHMNKFGLSYGTTDEFNFRLGVFAKADKEIKEINAKETSFKLGHNQYSTYTKEEMKKMAGFKAPDEGLQTNVKVLDTSDLPHDIDWVAQGVVAEIKNQGQCGSCWSFSATNCMESHHAIKTGELLDLSEQQYVDCVKNAYGCNGGWMGYAFDYSMTSPQDLEKDYKYKARQNYRCLDRRYKGKVSVQNYWNVPRESVDQLKAAITYGPVSVTLQSASRVFQNYESGILDSDDCGTDVDHAVNAVGYGVEDGKEYYLIRNSWGTWWGDEGYIKIAITPGVGTCGIQQWSLYPQTD